MDDSTGRRFKELQRRINREYRQAVEELTAKMEEFTAKYKVRDEAKRKQLAEGKITKQEYRNWVKGQVFQGKRWQERLDAAAKQLTRVDEAATDIINNERLDVFADNLNWQNKQAEHAVGIQFNLYDSATVARLLDEQPNLLPPRRVKRSSDIPWYHKQIANVVTQGILQGESIDKIAKRIGEATGERSRAAMIRNARTAMTSAQNAGRIEAMHQQQDMGIAVQKKWIAAHDSRTRKAHLALHGQTVDVDEPFKSMLGEIMFPGDPMAAPANVYNCRCALGYVYQERQESGKIKQGTQEQQAAASTPLYQTYQPDEHDAAYKALRDELKRVFEAEKVAQDEAFKAYNQRHTIGLDKYQSIIDEYTRLSRERSQIEWTMRSKYGIEQAAYAMQTLNVEYLPLKKTDTFDETAVIDRISGGDMTKGSCASLGLSYIGQKAGYNVLDFRGGESLNTFARGIVDVMRSLQNDGIETVVGSARSYVTAGKRALEQVKEGKEYYFECASHAAIVRKRGGQLEYLELQSGKQNGWMPFSRYGVAKTLEWRFGATKSSGRNVESYMQDVEGMVKSKRLMKILGYINTEKGKQNKGASGHER